MSLIAKAIIEFGPPVAFTIYSIKYVPVFSTVISSLPTECVTFNSVPLLLNKIFSPPSIESVSSSASV
jgi:hypothetical protein